MNEEYKALDKKPNDKQKKEIDDVKSIIANAMTDFHNYDFNKYINNYKRYLEFVGDRQPHIEPWQTNVTYPLVSGVIDTMFANIFDFGYEFGITEPSLKKLCIDSFDFKGVGKSVLKEIAKECLITGKAYTKDFIYKKSEKQKILNTEIDTELKIPSFQYVSVFDVMFDKSAGLEDSAYKIVRTFATGNKIRNKIMPLYLSEVDDKDRVTKYVDNILNKTKEDFSNRFSNYDYNAVKHLTSSVQLMNSYLNDNKLKSGYELPQMKCSGMGTSVAGSEGGLDNEKSSNYFLNKDNKTYEVIEFYTDDKKYIFINGSIAWFGKKDYNVGNIRQIEFSNIPGTGNANGIGDNLGGLQDIQNMLWNSFLDNIKLAMGPMFKITGNIPIGKQGKIDFSAFKAFRTNGQTDIEKISLGTTDFAPLNMMQAVQSAGENRSGANEYIMGGQGRAERVAGGIDLIYNQYKSKLTPITDSIDQMMADISRSWILMYLRHYTEDELNDLGVILEPIRKDPDDENSKIINYTINGVKVTDIISEKNISFSYNSLDKLEKETQRATLKELFQFILQYAGEQVNIDELIKGVMGLPFDYDEIVRFNEPQEAAQAEEDVEIEQALEQSTGMVDDYPEDYSGQETLQDTPEPGSEEDLLAQVQAII